MIFLLRLVLINEWVSYKMNEEGKYFDLARSEDYLECFVFPNPSNLNENNSSILGELCNEWNSFIMKLTDNYIWHKDSFKLVVPVLAMGLPPHLYSVQHYGDNIEDEWFVVYIMMELSKKFPQVLVRIVDSDGEFLLIEAANVLPDWADPRNCEGKVFIGNGEIKFVSPNASMDSEDSQDADITEVINEIRCNKYDKLVSRNITNILNKRLSMYPNRIVECLHRSTVYTPVGVAAILKESPELISAAVQAFCNRDPIDMKACRAMKYFPPENRVNTCVTFTKCLYAMLMHSQFNPDRKIGWNLPLSCSPEYKMHSLGIKLACGFEILASQAAGENEFNEKGWNNYCEFLKQRGYFRDLLPGSKDYTKLLETAKEYYIKNELSNIGPNIGKRIINMINNLNCDISEFSKFESTLPPDDDDSWLNIDPKELDKLLEDKYGPKSTLNQDRGPVFISKKISDFLDQKSGIQGVEMMNSQKQENNLHENYFEPMPQRPKRRVRKKGKKQKNVSFSTEVKTGSPKMTVQNNIDFDPDQFSNALQNILVLMIPDDNWDLDSGTDFSEYGSDKDIESHIENLRKIEQTSDSAFEGYVKQMDEELLSTTVKSSLVKDKYNSEVVDEKQNLYKNITQSFREEGGGSGPAGNIFGSMGIAKHNMIQAIDSDDDDD